MCQSSDIAPIMDEDGAEDRRPFIPGEWPKRRRDWCQGEAPEAVWPHRRWERYAGVVVKTEKEIEPAPAQGAASCATRDIVPIVDEDGAEDRGPFIPGERQKTEAIRS